MKKRKNNKIFPSFLLCSVLLGIVSTFSACGKKHADSLPLGEVNEAPEDYSSGDIDKDINDEITTDEQPLEEESSNLPIIEKRETVNGKIQSYLTGEWMDKKIAERRPIAVMIPNNAPAMPQYGLS